MKNLLKLFLTAVLAMSVVCSMVACSTPDNGGDEPQQPPVGDVTVTSSAELNTALSTLKQGQKVILKAGSYETEINVPAQTFPTEITAEVGVTVKNMVIFSTAKDVTIKNVNFEGKGVTLMGGTNITIKDCKFTGTATLSNVKSAAAAMEVTNLVVDGCVFKDISAGAQYVDGTWANGVKPLTAILIQQFNGLTVKNCDFDNVEYNALQLGAESANGEVYITNNIFRSSIGSRYINVAKAPGKFFVEGNTFYRNLDSYSANPTDGFKKSTGIYIEFPQSFEALQVKTNTWELIPSGNDPKFISLTNSRHYEESEQLSLN